MKKFLVFSFAAFLILGLPTLALAANIVVGGELALQFTKNGSNDTITTFKDIDATNIHVDATLNDDVSVRIQVSLVNDLAYNGTPSYLYIDDSYITVKHFGIGTLRVGKTGFCTTGLAVNLSNAGGMNDYGYSVTYAVPVAKNFSAAIGYAVPDVATTSINGYSEDLAFNLNYQVDGTGANFYYNAMDKRFDLLAMVKLNKYFQIKGLYGENIPITAVGLVSQWGVDCTYTNGDFCAMAEYDDYSAQNPYHPDSAQYVRLIYTFKNGFGTVLQWDNDNVNYLGREKLLFRVNF